MGTKSVRLDDDVYERVIAHKRADETISEAIDRLIGSPSLHELGGILDGDHVDEMRKTIEDADEEDAAEVEEVAERFR
nr:antitoxin VapB family protein [Salinirubrum litoreum]